MKAIDRCVRCGCSFIYEPSKSANSIYFRDLTFCKECLNDPETQAELKQLRGEMI